MLYRYFSPEFLSFYPLIEIISEENDYIPTENDVDLIYPAGKPLMCVSLITRYLVAILYWCAN